MVIKHIKQGIKIGMEAGILTTNKVLKLLGPTIKIGKVSVKEAKSIARDILELGKKHKKKIENTINTEVKGEIKKMGLISKKEANLLKAKIKKLEKMLKSKLK